MNERIIEMAKQCGDWSGQTIEMNDVGIAKFAELIAKECEQISLKNSHRDDDMGAIIARHIKKYFGVK
jgi:hypothetical protein